MQKPHLKVTSGYFWKYLGMSDEINFISRLILEILDFHEICNLIGQEQTQMCLATFSWNLWSNFLFFWISIKSHLKLIFHFEILWACPAMSDQTQLIISMDVYLHKKLIRNHAIWSVNRTLTIKQNLRTCLTW